MTAECASGGSSSAADSKAPDATVIWRLPNLRHSAPEMSIVASAPADMPSSARPSAAGDAPVCCFTAGTRTAQDA